MSAITNSLQAPVRGVAPGDAGLGDTTAFTQRQAWLREYEQAAMRQRQEAMPDQQHSKTPALPCQADGDAIAADSLQPGSWIDTWPDAGHDAQLAQALAQDAPALRVGQDDAPPSQPHADPMPSTCLAWPMDAGALAARSAPAAPPASGDAAEMTPLPTVYLRPADAPRQDYAERALTVFVGAGSLSVTLRDARLPSRHAESILRELASKGLPPGTRRVSVTLNGRTTQLHLHLSERT